MKWMRLNWSECLKKVALFCFYSTLTRLLLVVLGLYFYGNADGFMSAEQSFLYLLWGFIFNQIYVLLKSEPVKRLFFAVNVLAVIAFSLDSSILIDFHLALVMHFVFAFSVYLLGVRSAGFGTDHYAFLRSVKLSTALILVELFFFRSIVASKAIIPYLAAYIVAALVTLAILNLEKLQKGPLKSHLEGIRKKWMLLSLFISIFIVIITGLLYGLYSPDFLQTIGIILYQVYSVFAKIIMTILYPILYVLSFLVNALLGLILKRVATGRPGQEIQLNNDPLFQEEAVAGLPAYIQVILNTFVLLTIAGILIFILIKVLRPFLTYQQDDLEDERESVYSKGQMKKNLSNVLKRLKVAFGRRSLFENTPANLCRKIYVDLLVISQKAGFQRKQGNTAREFQKSIATAFHQTDDAAVAELTDIYELARYHPAVVTENEVTAMKDIVKTLTPSRKA